MTQVRPVRALAPHLVWEGMLLLVAAGLVAGVLNANDQAFTRGAPWASMAILGFVATGLALSLRTATPNLAVGGIAALAGWVYVEQADGAESWVVPFVVAVLAAAGAGLVLALVVGLTSLPAWAVTLGGGFVISGGLLAVTDARMEPLRGAGGRVTDGYGFWLTGFIIASIAGGILFAVPAVRRKLAATRPVGEDPARWRPAKLVGALVGVGGSALVVGVAGVVNTMYVGGAGPADQGWLAPALAAVLLGGISPHGRRGGIFGVALAVVVVDLVRRWEILEGAESSTVMITVGVLGFVGLIVSWLLELLGRRIAPFDPAGVLPAADGPAAFGVPGAPGASGQFGAPGQFGVPGRAGVSGASEQAGAFGRPGSSEPLAEGPVFGQPIFPAGPTSGGPAQPVSGGPPAGQPQYRPVPGGPSAGQPPYAPPGYPPAPGQPPYPPIPGQQSHPGAGQQPYPGPGQPQYPGPAHPQHPGPGQPPHGTIPQPWTVPGTDTTPPQVPSQPLSPPVSGPPSGHPQTPPPSWPPQT